MENPIKMDDLGWYYHFRKHPYVFFTPKPGEMIQSPEPIFQIGLVQPGN